MAATKAQRQKKRRDQETDLEAKLALKSCNINFRTRPFIRDRLRASASVSARSVSEEIEYRLNQTFTDDDLLKSVAWNEESASPTLIRLIFTAINQAEVDAAGGVGGARVTINLKWWNENPKRARELADTVGALIRAVLVDGVSPLRTDDDYRKELSAAATGAGRFRSKAEFRAWSVLLAAGFVSRGSQQSVADRKAELRTEIEERHRTLDYIESVEQIDEQNQHFDARPREKTS
jgi:hypothetical protein